MAIYMPLKRSEARAAYPSFQRVENATRNLQRGTSLSRINHIRVELGIFEKETRRMILFPECLFADLEFHMKHRDTITLNLNPKDKSGVF